MSVLPRGLYVIADSAWGEPGDLALRAAELGARVVQVRAKGWSTARVVATVGPVRDQLRTLGCLLVINDDLDAAEQLDADGLHLGQDDGPLAQARQRLGPSVLIGRSTHTPAQVLEAQDADYLGYGPVFPTGTKDTGYTARSLEALAEACTLSARPVVAIGGIQPQHVPALEHAGAWCWAVISGLWTAPDLAVRMQDYRGAHGGPD